MRIQDGKGNGHEAKVDSANRLRTHAITESESLHANEEGNSYNLNTGLLAMSANGTLLYIKNTGTKDIVVESLIIAEFTGITHSNNPYITLVRNPTGGDLISDATAISMNQNRNFASSNTLSATVYSGKSSGTLTGGNNLGIVQVSSAGRTSLDLGLILPKGSSLGISLTANISSGSANYYAAALVFEKEDTTD